MSIDITQTTLIPAGTWTIDPCHSEVGFTVRHLMSKVRGQFETFDGTIVTTDDVAGFRADASIDLNSINTRDEQPRRPPPLRRLLRRREQRPDDLHDHLVRRNRRRGATSPSRASPARSSSTSSSSASTWTPTATPRIGYEATTEISRKAFGVDFNIPLDGGKVLVGDKVTVVLSVQAILAQ